MNELTLFQHDETGRTTCVDEFQIENGWERQNPRWQRVADCKIVKVETLQLIYDAMNHMGDALNNMDAVDAEDEAATSAAFDAIRELLGENKHG